MKKLISVLTFGIFAFSSLWADNAYGIPEDIQDGNILQCFNWPLKTITQNLQAIAESGYGAVQVSPLQRADVKSNWHWYDLYCPADVALKESSALGTRNDLINLCTQAEQYGIKVIVDVVANHINWTSGYYDTWWTENNRNRNGRNQPAIGSNYNTRSNITQNRMGDYFDTNTESQEVIDRVVAYIQDLASCGVKGIRWDAAKHIALPSESQGGPFWATVTSCVPGMYHYGEILDEPANGQPALIKEYAQYMSVTDNRYSNIAARSNGGIPTSANGNWVNNQGLPASKIVYWGESHDTYSNDEWSQDVDQEVIDRAYASVACRNGSTALYLARPSKKGFGNITITKGTDAYKSKAVAEVNKFRNKMTGRADFFSNNGNAVSITRDNGGAVIVCKTSGSVSITNGNGYCPAGTYTDRVSGNTFTVTSSTISGTVGDTGIAVIYNDELGDFDPSNGGNDVTPTGDWNVYFDNSKSNWTTVCVYAYSPDALGSWPGTTMTYDSESGYYKLASSQDLSGYNLIFNNGSSNQQTGDNVAAIKNGIYVYAGQKVTEGVYTGQTYESPDDNADDGNGDSGNVDDGNSDGGNVDDGNGDGGNGDDGNVDDGNGDDGNGDGDGEVTLPEEKDEAGISGIVDDAQEAIYYNLQGRRVYNPVKGIFIKVTGNKHEKVLIK